MEWFRMFLDSWIGLLIGGIGMLLYMKGKLGKFPFYDRIASWVFEAPADNSLEKTEEFLSQLKEAVVNQILNGQPQLFDAIAKQRIILDNQDREPVAIFLNKDTFKALLHNALDGKQPNEVEDLYDAIKGLDMPIGHLGVLPIYVSELLLKAPVFVAGGIRWEYVNKR